MKRRIWIATVDAFSERCVVPSKLTLIFQGGNVLGMYMFSALKIADEMEESVC